MANRNKEVKSFNLVQGDTVIPVSVKTTTEKYFAKLIRDYRKLNKLSLGRVDIVPVVPQFR